MLTATKGGASFIVIFPIMPVKTPMSSHSTEPSGISEIFTFSPEAAERMVNSKGNHGVRSLTGLPFASSSGPLIWPRP